MTTRAKVAAFLLLCGLAAAVAIFRVAARYLSPALELRVSVSVVVFVSIAIVLAPTPPPSPMLQD